MSHHKEHQSSEPEHPGDKTLNNKPVHATKDTSEADTKSETNAGKQRQKMS